MELQEILSKQGWLDGLEENDARALMDLAKLEAFEPGDIIIPEMTRSRDIYFLSKGAVSVSMLLPFEGRRQEVIDTIHAGDIIGEVAFVDGSPRSATVKAEEPAELYVYPFDELNEFLEEHPRVGYQLMKAVAKTISAKMRQANLAWRNLMMW